MCKTDKFPEPIIPWPRPVLFLFFLRILFMEFNSVKRSFRSGRARAGHHSINPSGATLGPEANRAESRSSKREVLTCQG